MIASLRDDLVARTEIRSSARRAAAQAACQEAQEILTEEPEERLRKHWPRMGRTEVGRLRRLFSLCACPLPSLVCFDYVRNNRIFSMVCRTHTHCLIASSWRHPAPMPLPLSTLFLLLILLLLSATEIYRWGRGSLEKESCTRIARRPEGIDRNGTDTATIRKKSPYKHKKRTLSTNSSKTLTAGPWLFTQLTVAVRCARANVFLRVIRPSTPFLSVRRAVDNSAVHLVQQVPPE